jgi:hypothetical protein
VNKPRNAITDRLASATGIAPKVRSKAEPPPSRRDRQCYAVYFDPGVIKQIKQLTLEHDTTQQALAEEAYNLLFARYGVPQIA